MHSLHLHRHPDHPTRLLRLPRYALAFALASCLALVAGSPSTLAAIGQVTEFQIPPPGGRPNAIVLGSDGAVWFTELSSPAIGRFGDGAFSRFPTPNATLPFSLAAGPDGALWFTEPTRHRIGRLTIAGRFREFDLPPCTACGPYSYDPVGITAGPDGALWYARPVQGSIGRITIGGNATEFPVGSPEAGPRWITTGPDGALWFTDETGLGRITTGGSISQVWSGMNYPSAVAAGPDGNLWVTGAAQDSVGRVTTSGQANLFRLDLNCNPQWIAPGAGALWVACYNLDEVERVSTTGRVTRVSVPGHIPNYPDVISGIVKGPGGMWFTEYAANRLGRISIS
jgi:virginiamycin B lyase